MLLQDSELRKSVFYQDTAGAICERRHAGKDADSYWTWHPTELKQEGALLGTSLAATQSDDGDEVALFYQASDGYIFLRYSNAAMLVINTYNV